MGIEYSPQRKKYRKQAAKARKNSTTYGGPVVTRKIGEPPPEDDPRAPRMPPPRGWTRGRKIPQIIDGQTRGQARPTDPR